MARDLTATTKTKEKAVSVKTMIEQPSMVSRFADVLGGRDKANQFLASVVSAVNGNSNLAACNPKQVLGCAMIAASLNLDVNPNLGFAAIVPYKKKYKNEQTGKWEEYQVPQFQMGWKGFVQLAMRTGKYKTMNVTEIYEDEFDAYDPFKGELQYHLVSNGDRANGRLDKIVGYTFFFELVSGFQKMTFMSKEEAEAHALRFSKAYQNDKKYNEQKSPWSTMFDKMAEKTIVKNTLNKWGILSTQMIQAELADQATTADVDSSGSEYEYVDNNNPEVSTTVEKITTAEETYSDPEEQSAGPEEFEDTPFDEMQAYGESLYGGDGDELPEF